MEQASSLFSRAEVPAKDHAGVHHWNGTKIVELVDPISAAQRTSTVDDQPPPLLLMIIDGFPPFQQSKYVDEAEKRLHQYVERFPNVITWDSYCRIGLSAASYVHPGIISVDRLVMLSINYTLQFLLDDLFFDTPDEFVQDQYGVSRRVCESPERIQEYFAHLDAVYSQQAQPRTPVIETIIWEAGRDTLELSNPEWFRKHVACVVEHHRVTAASHADLVQGHNSCFQDLDLYTGIRGGNFGGTLVQMLIEFASDTYIPDALRESPYMESVTTATSIHLGFTNDVFSYHKESTLEQNLAI